MPENVFIMKTYAILIPAFLVLFTACRSEKKEESSIPEVGVRTTVVMLSDFVEPVRATGKLATKTESKLSFKTGGIIYRIHADEGQSVSGGELLAELNPEEIRSRASQAELALRKAERDFTRAGNLYRDSVVTLEQYENAKTALDVARSNNRIARFNLKYSSIHAPSDGKILKRTAETNEIIAPGHPVFIFAPTGNDWVVRTNLTDRDIIRVDMLDSASVYFDAYPDGVFGGLITEIGTAADPYTGTYEVEIRMLKKPDKPISGFIARIEIFPSGTGKRIIVPYEAMVDGSGMTGYVYVVDDGKHFRRRISIESFSDKGIIIKDGLSEGEEIIVEGSQYLRSGTPIQIMENVK
jgi:RND family efflux transporter MFP subunit